MFVDQDHVSAWKILQIRIPQRLYRNIKKKNGLVSLDEDVSKFLKRKYGE